jgi:hypothetical protein
MERQRKKKTNPPNNRERSAEGLMHITNSLTVQEEEFAQLKYSDVQPFAAVGLREAQRSGADRSIQHKTVDNRQAFSCTTETFTFRLLKKKRKIKPSVGKKLFLFPFSVSILIFYATS